MYAKLLSFVHGHRAMRSGAEAILAAPLPVHLEEYVVWRIVTAFRLRLAQSGEIAGLRQGFYSFARASPIQPSDMVCSLQAMGDEAFCHFI